jgi:O-antigen/teichoic acid export membrane protein
MFNSFFKINNNSLLFILTALLNSGISFALTPLYTRILSLSDFGILSVYQVWVTIISIFIGLNIQSSIPNTKVDFNPVMFKTYITNYAKFIFIFSLSIVFLLLVFNNYMPVLVSNSPNNLNIYITINAIGIALFSFYSIYNIHTKNGKSYFFSTIAIIFTLHLLSICFILYLESNKFYGKIYANIIVYMTFMVFFYYYYLNKNNTFTIPKKYLIYSLPISVPLILHLISNQLIGHIDRVFLDRYLNSESVAVYSLAYTLGSIGILLSEGLQNIWTPWYFKKLKENKIKEIEILAGRYTSIIALSNIVVIFFSKNLLSFFGPPSYQAASSILPIITISVFFLFLYRFPLTYIHYKKKTKYIPIITISIAALNIILNIFLIPEFKMLGAAYATLISYLLFYLFTELICRFKLKGFTVNINAYIIYAIPVILITILELFTTISILLKLVSTLILFVIHIYIHEKKHLNKFFSH